MNMQINSITIDPEDQLIQESFNLTDQDIEGFNFCRDEVERINERERNDNYNITIDKESYPIKESDVIADGVKELMLCYIDMSQIKDLNNAVCCNNCTKNICGECCEKALRERNACPNCRMTPWVKRKYTNMEKI